MCIYMILMKFFNAIKIPLITGIIIFIFTMSEIYFSIGRLSNSLSADCTNCLFIEDALFFSLITSLLSMLLFNILQRLKHEKIRLLIGFIFLNLIWLYWNYVIFVDRESAWSTYSFKEELFYTIYSSILPITILSTLAILTKNKLEKII